MLILPKLHALSIANKKVTEEAIKSLIPEFLLHSEIYSLVITDLEGRYIFVNEVFKKRFSFICENFIGQSSFIAIYPEDHAICLHAVEQCLANPEKVVKVNLRKPDTSQENFYWTAWEFSAFKDKNGNVIGILCLGHDITETQRASKIAKEFAQKVETIIEEITDGFYQLDREWKFVKINKVAEQILGLPREYILGKCLWDLFPDTTDYNYPTQFKKAMQDNITVTFEDYRPDLDRWFSAVCYPSLEGLTVFFRDITQEKNNQITLQNSENKLKALYDSTADSNLLISPTGKILNFNKKANEIALNQFQKDLQINQPVEEFLLPEGKKIFEMYFPKALQGETHQIEVERQIGDKKMWFEVSYLPVYDKNNLLIGVSINTKDIDERKQAELKLKEKEYMLRAIYHSTTQASSFIDKNFIIRYNNQIAQYITKQIFGKEAQIGDKSLDYVLPEYRAEFESYYKRVLQGEIISVERTDGTNWWLLSMYPVYDEQQQIIGIAHNVKDLTEQKTKEIQLQESEHKLQKIIESIPHPFLIVNEELTIQYVNDEFEKIFGYTESEVLNQTVDFLLPERFREGHSFLQKNYLGEGGIFVKKIGRFLPAITKNGKEIFVSATLNTFSVFSERFVIVILQDVTELKKRQDTILQQNKTLQEIAWLQSHELRRPVANILGLCDLLKNYQNETEEMKNKYIDYMLQAAKELDEIIHRIVDKTN